MPFAGYPDHAACVADNGDKANPHAFCAWLEHQVTGKWPAESQAGMPSDAWAIYRDPYAAHLTLSKKPQAEAEHEANQKGLDALKQAGWLFSRIGWVKQYAAPSLRTVSGVRVFAVGTWTDSKGVERDWTEEDLDGLVKAFNAGVPGNVPVKAGHTPDSFNGSIAEKLGVPVELITGDIGGKGQVALGRMATLERRGPLLFATFERVPDPIADLIDAGLFSTVSVEVEGPIGEFPSALTAVALLGAEEPAVDVATLDRALVFGGKREAAMVLTFQTSDLPLAVLEEEFKTLKSKVQESIKGMRGAPVFRAMMANLGTLFDAMKRNQSGHQAPDNQEGGPTMESVKGMSLKDLAAKYQITEEEIMVLATTLGLGEGATIEDIVAAIEALKAKAGVGAPEGPPVEAQKGEFAKVTSELQKANEKISALEHRERVAAWYEQTRPLQSIPGKPEDMADELAEIEESRGKDKAQTHFECLKTVNRSAFEANKVRGVALTGEKRADFEKEVAEYQKTHEKANRGQAVKAIMLAKPDLYREYQAEARARQDAG